MHFQWLRHGASQRSGTGIAGGRRSNSDFRPWETVILHLRRRGDAFPCPSALSHQGRLIHIYHAGSIENIQPILEKSGLPSEQYHELGPLPYDQAMEAAKAAHICSAIISYTTGLGTKIFDYIYLNKPIIAYAPPGSEFEETLKGAENAYVCQTAPQMEAAIEAIIRDGGYQLTKSLEFRQRFSREAQNQIYHQLLRKTTGQHLEEKEAPN